MMEMRITLAKLIWNYDLELAHEDQEEPTYDHRQISAGELKIRVKRAHRELLNEVL